MISPVKKIKKIKKRKEAREKPGTRRVIIEKASSKRRHVRAKQIDEKESVIRREYCRQIEQRIQRL